MGKIKDWLNKETENESGDHVDNGSLAILLFVAFIIGVAVGSWLS